MNILPILPGRGTIISVVFSQLHSSTKRPPVKTRWMIQPDPLEEVDLSGGTGEIAVTSDHPGTLAVDEVHHGGVGHFGGVRAVHGENKLYAGGIGRRAFERELMLPATGHRPGAGVQALEGIHQLTFHLGVKGAAGAYAGRQDALSRDRCRINLVDQELVVLGGVGGADTLGNVGGRRVTGNLLEQYVGAGAGAAKEHEHDQQRQPESKRSLARLFPRGLFAHSHISLFTTRTWQRTTRSGCLEKKAPLYQSLSLSVARARRQRSSSTSDAPAAGMQATDPTSSPYTSMKAW